jgi:hypothetical protein
VLGRALVSGSVASVLSTVAISAGSYRQTGSAFSGTNATSHWLWGEQAKHRRAPSLRHTLPGYAIHHGSAVFWACLFETLNARQSSRCRQATTAALTSAIAYTVDYHVVPTELWPGYERRLSPSGMVGTYVAVAAGLYLGRRLFEHFSRRHEAVPAQPPAPHAVP